MLLSKLVYLCIKNAIYDDDESFTYEQFLEGRFDEDPKFSNQINNVFSPLNEAISRLSDLDKIPHIIDSVATENNFVSFSSLSREFKEILNVAFEDKLGRLKASPYMKINGGIQLRCPFPYTVSKILVEYKEEIPFLDKTHYDDELSDYGLNTTMCNYIIEYVAQGFLGRIADESLANMHRAYAEQYFANIPSAKNELMQSKVAVVFPID